MGKIKEITFEEAQALGTLGVPTYIGYGETSGAFDVCGRDWGLLSHVPTGRAPPGYFVYGVHDDEHQTD
jgi:hypothetical protein